jgi:hypothetical protein
MQGHSSDAWDFLGTAKFRSVDTLSEAYTLRAAIRGNAWAKVITVCRCRCSNAASMS